MNSEEVKGIATCLILGTALLATGFRRFKQVRKVQDTARSRSSAAPQGFVELEGFAWPAEQVVDAGEGFEAVYYSVCLQQRKKKSGKKNSEWVTVYERVYNSPFFLVDSAGLVLIDPQQGGIHVEKSRIKAWQNIPQKDKQRLLDTVILGSVPNFPPSNFLFGIFGQQFRIVEKDIRVGSPLYASGHFNTSGGEAVKTSSPGLTAFAEKVFDQARRATKSFVVFFDKNKDGKVDPSEARSGYSTMAKIARGQAKVQKAEEKDFALYGNLSVSANHALMLADTHENHLVERLNKYLWMQFSGGSALVMFGIFLALSPVFPGSLKPQKNRQPAATLSAQELHHQCIAGLADSCRILLDKKIEFQLSDQHFKYYRSQYCQKEPQLLLPECR